MFVALSATALTLACQGCSTTGSPHVAASSEKVVPPSLAMTLAVPRASVATTPTADRTIASSVHTLSTTGQRFEGQRIAVPGAMPVFDLTGNPAEFEVSDTFNPRSTLGLEWTGNEPLTYIAAEQSSDALISPTEAGRDIAAEIAFAAPKEATGLNLDVGLAPRFSFVENGDLTSRRVGGEVRMGTSLGIIGDKLGTPEGWYIFAGADGEALVWDAQGLTPNLNDMALTDKVTVGDLQAGVSVQRAGGELSLSYIHREVRYADRNGSIETKEDFAGLSFTMRR